jgi:hypothetical protein
MEAPRIDELISRVVAWHNRHGLAQRITSAHVRSIGVVVLPFVASDVSGSMSKTPGCQRVPVFSEDFIAPLTPRQVAAFALRHGSPEHPGTATWSQRMVPADPGHESAELSLLYLRTASIELGNHRCRVLIGSGPNPQIIGPRAWSMPRIAGVSATATAVAASAVLSLVLLKAPEQPETLLSASAPPVPTHDRAASVPAVASAPVPVRLQAAASAAGTEKIDPPSAVVTAASGPVNRASAAASAGSAAVAAVESMALSASAPSPVAARVPRQVAERAPAVASNRDPAIPAIRPMLDNDLRASALLESRRLRAMAPAPRGASTAHDSQPVFAVVTATTRTRNVAERGQRVMGSSASARELPGNPRSELMQVADGWRAVLWPFRNRDDAKVAQAMLSERGVRTEVLEF